MLSLSNNISSTQAVEAKYSADFDGTDDFIDTGHHFSDVFNDSFSISLWVKPDDGQPSVSEYFFGINDNNEDIVRAELLTNGKVKFVIEGNNDTLSTETPNETFINGGQNSVGFTHLLFVVTKSSGSANTTVDIYVNGVDTNNTFDSLSEANHALFASSENLVIGARNQAGTIKNFFSGKIDEFAIFNTALGSDEPLAIYNNGSPFNLKINQGNYNSSSALQSYYKMGDGFFDDKTNGVVHDQDNPGFGNNLVVNADFSANEAEDQANLNGGLQFDNWVENQTSGLRKFELTSDGEGIRCTIETASTNNFHQRIHQDVSSVLTVGDVYEFSVEVLCSLARNFQACIETTTGTGDQFDPDDVALSANTRTLIKKFFICTETSNSGRPMVFHLFPLGDVLPSGEFYEVRNPSLKKLNGKPGLTSGGVTFSSDTP